MIPEKKILSMAAHPLASDLEEIFFRLGPLWEEFRGQSIFLTGGTGFFGKWLLESFVRANHRLSLGLQVLVLTRNKARLLTELPYLAQEKAIRFMHGDVRTFTFPEEKFSYVIHMATTSAEATFSGEKPLEKFTTSVMGTQRVLEFTARCGASKLLLTSSGNAYGPIPSGLAAINENHIGAPDLENPVASALGEGKRAAELLSRIYSANHGFEVKICRCFSFIGPYLQTDIHYAAGNFIRDAAAGNPIHIRGDGTPIRSFLYPTDMIVWLMTLLLRAPSGRLYNLGSEEAISIRALAERIALRSGSEVIIDGTRNNLPTSSPDSYVPSISRIINEHGVIREVSLDVAIDRTLEFHKKHSASGKPRIWK
ncbi:MAG: NAD(P)-dependent oxidoreductase [Betaproteobacteria bacterium]